MSSDVHLAHLTCDYNSDSGYCAIHHQSNIQYPSILKKSQASIYLMELRLQRFRGNIRMKDGFDRVLAGWIIIIVFPGIANAIITIMIIIIMKILKNYQIFKVSSNPQQGLRHHTQSPPPPRAAPEHHWGGNIWKLDQVYCAWLIKWVVKREIIQLAELCPMKWWIIFISCTWWYWVSIIGIIPKKYHFFSASLSWVTQYKILRGEKLWRNKIQNEGKRGQSKKH